MEIIKILLGIFLFFYLEWIQIVYLITGTIVYFYFKYNPFLQNSSYEYNYIYSMIYSVDFLFEIINYVWSLIIKNNYINYLPLKLEELNKKYLQYKMKCVFYLIGKLTNLLFSFNRKETPKNKVQEIKSNISKIKLDTNEEMMSFLDKIEYNLKNKAN